MKYSAVLSAVCLTALMAAQAPGATAAELPPPPKFRPAILEWSGPYAGFEFGGAFFETDYLPTPGADPHVDGGGFLAGGLVGYNIQSGSFVYGVEGDISLGEVDGKSNGNKFNIEKIATLHARLGFANGASLFYITGGLAAADVEIDSAALAGFAGKDEQWLWGYTVGAGVEYAFGNMRMRGEYLFADFDDDTWTFPGGTIKSGIDQTHIIRAAMIWQFASGY